MRICVKYVSSDVVPQYSETIEYDLIEGVELIDHLKAIRLALGNPLKLEECALQVDSSGLYLDPSEDVGNQIANVSPGSDFSLVLKPDLLIERLVSSLRKYLEPIDDGKLRFELMKLRAKVGDSTFVEEFIYASGLSILLEIVVLCSGNIQGLAIKILSDFVGYEAGMNSLLSDESSLETLYKLSSSSTQLTVTKRVLELLLILISLSEDGAMKIYSAAHNVDRITGKEAFTTLVEQLESPDIDAQLTCITILNTSIQKCTSQDMLFNMLKALSYDEVMRKLEVINESSDDIRLKTQASRLLQTVRLVAASEKMKGGEQPSATAKARAPDIMSQGKDANDEMLIVDHSIKPDHCGYIMKRGGRVKSWKKRYVVIIGHFMWYFKTEKDKKALGQLLLQPPLDVKEGAPSIKAPKKGHFVFELYVPGGMVSSNHASYAFAVTGEKGRSEWIKAIETAIGANVSVTEKPRTESDSIANSEASGGIGESPRGFASGAAQEGNKIEAVDEFVPRSKDFFEAEEAQSVPTAKQTGEADMVTSELKLELEEKEQKILGLIAENTELRRENVEVKERGFEKEREALEKENADFKIKVQQVMKAINAKIEEKDKENSELRTELKILRGKADQGEGQGTTTNFLNMSADEAENLQSNVEELKGKLEAERSKYDQLLNQSRTQMATINSLEERNKSDQDTLSGKIDFLYNSLEEKHEEKDSLEEELRKSNSLVDEMKGEMMKFSDSREKEVSKYEKKVSSLVGRISDLEAEIEKEAKDTGLDESEAKKLKDELHLVTSKKLELEEEMETANAELLKKSEDYDRLFKEKERLNNDYIEQQGSQNALERQLSILKEKQTEILNTKEGEVKRLKQLVSSKETELMLAQLDGEKTDQLKEELRESESVVKQLRYSLTWIKKKTKSSVDAYEAKIKILESDVETSEKRVAELEEASSSATGATSDLEKEMISLKEKNSKLHRDLIQSIKLIERANEKVKAAEKSENALKQDVDKLKGQIGTYTSKIENVRKYAAKLESDLDLQEAKKYVEQEQIENLKKEVHELKDKLSAQRDLPKHSDDTLKKQVEELTKEKQSLENDAVVLRSKIDNLLSDMKDGGGEGAKNAESHEIESLKRTNAESLKLSAELNKQFKIERKKRMELEKVIENPEALAKLRKANEDLLKLSKDLSISLAKERSYRKELELNLKSSTEPSAEAVAINKKLIQENEVLRKAVIDIQHGGELPAAASASMKTRPVALEKTMEDSKTPDTENVQNEPERVSSVAGEALPPISFGFDGFSSDEESESDEDLGEEEEADSIPGAPPAPPGAPPAPPGAPPAPGIPSAPGAGPTKHKITPGVKMRPLYWDRVILGTGTKQKTIWDDMNEIEIDSKRFEDVFGVIEIPKKQVEAKKVTKISVIDQNKSRGISILLSKIRSVEEIKEGLRTFNDKIISLEILESLSSNIPSEDELDQIKTAAAANEGIPLDKPEEVLMQLSQLPSLDIVLGAWKFVLSWPEKLSSISKPILDVKYSLSELRKSKAFYALLSAVLTYGNYLNGGTRRGQADGFDVSFLSKLNDTKSRTGITLLEYILQELRSRYTGIVNLGEELQHIEGSSEVDLEQLQESITKCRSDVSESLRKLADIENASEYPRMDWLVSSLSDILSEIAILEKEKKKTKRSFSKHLLLFGTKDHRVKDINSRDYFGELLIFLKSCRSVFKKWREEDLRVGLRKRRGEGFGKKIKGMEGANSMSSLADALKSGMGDTMQNQQINPLLNMLKK